MMNTIRFQLLGSALTVGGHHTLGLVLAVAAVIFAVAVVDSIRSGM